LEVGGFGALTASALGLLGAPVSAFAVALIASGCLLQSWAEKRHRSSAVKVFDSEGTPMVGRERAEKLLVDLREVLLP
jgi:hypothetical protein